jgi:vacuolar protein sorting-associated protein 45
MPELKRISGNLSKHVTLSSEISKMIEDRSLMSVSELEQKIVSSEASSDHFKANYLIKFF